MKFAKLSEIENADYLLYSTCRGTTSRQELEEFVSILLDSNANQDDYDYAVNDGLWDLFCHQYTFYSATPLALYLLLTFDGSKNWRDDPEVVSFVELCIQRGNEAIQLYDNELVDNEKEKLLIFSIPDILKMYA